MVEKSVEVVALLKMNVSSFEHLAKSKQVNINFASSIDKLNVVIDSVKLERIIFNLVSNSLKFAPKGSNVDVILEIYNPHQKQEFCILIKDNGKGINQDALKNVFDKFYQEKDNSNHDYTGSGLGLYIVNQFLKKMGGTIMIDSTKDIGTTAMITLPIKNTEEPEKTDIPTDTTQNSSLSEAASSILVVEDNKDLQDYISSIFSPYYNVITASDGKTALETASDELPDIIISDIMMPEMDGLTFCKKVKENILTSDIMIVLLTAKTSLEEEFTGYKYGADVYIKKPFDPDILASQIKNLLKTRKERKMHLLEQIASPDNKNIRSEKNEEFLDNSLKIIQQNIADPDFQVDNLALEMGISRSALFKKFKQMVGKTPNHFIRIVRLKKAAALLIESNLNINEIGYLVGFNQSHYFIRCFKEHFNCTPGKYRASKSKRNEPTK